MNLSIAYAALVVIGALVVIALVYSGKWEGFSPSAETKSLAEIRSLAEARILNLSRKIVGEILHFCNFVFTRIYI